jgi:radical SAM protein with 4Fe4S-binding SPASM domain
MGKQGFWNKQKRRIQKYSYGQILRPRMLNNLARNLLECRNGRTVLKSKPWNVIVELTANCNLKCKMCDVGLAPYDPAKDMDWKLFTDIGEKLFPYALMVDLRSQGESTIYRHWDQVLDYLGEFSTHFYFTTNGMKLTQEAAVKMARLKMGVTVSFDGASADTFESIRVGANFEHVCKNIKTLAEAQRFYGNPVRNLALRVTAQYDNLNEIPDIIDLAYSLGVRVVNIQSVYTNDGRELKHHAEFAEKQLLLAKNRGEKLGMLEVDIPNIAALLPAENNNGGKKQSADMTYCNDPWKTVNIGNDGKLYACCYGFTIPMLGDLRESDFDEIWNGKQYQSLRATVNSPEPWPECRICYQKNRYG